MRKKMGIAAKILLPLVIGFIFLAFSVFLTGRGLWPSAGRPSILFRSTILP